MGSNRRFQIRRSKRPHLHPGVNITVVDKYRDISGFGRLALQAGSRRCRVLLRLHLLAFTDDICKLVV